MLQPLLVSTSAIELATETVGLLLRIDECVLPLAGFVGRTNDPVQLPSYALEHVDLTETESRSLCHTFAIDVDVCSSS